MKIKNMQDIWVFLENADTRVRYAVFGALLFVFFLLDYTVLMRPQLSTLAKINPEIKILSGDIEKTRTDIARFATYIKEVAALEASYAAVADRIRTKREVPLILERVSALATRYDVRIDQIMPNMQDQKKLLENKERRYFSLPIFIEARAGYHDLGRFLSAVETDGTLQMGSFTIAGTPNSRLHAVRMTLQAIVYEEL